MIERLFTYAILLEVGLLTSEEYNNYLDSLFIKSPNNDLLLELEWESSNTRKTIVIIRNHCEMNTIEYKVFGQILLKNLKRIYFQGEIKLHTFSTKIYKVWKELPSNVQEIEPFWIMSYADDPLSWGDEEQTRKLYENMFDFYNK